MQWNSVLVNNIIIIVIASHVYGFVLILYELIYYKSDAYILQCARSSIASTNCRLTRAHLAINIQLRINSAFEYRLLIALKRCALLDH